MSVIPIRPDASSRSARMLRTALGPEVARWLDEPAVIEVMLNPDGRLWVDRLGSGLAATDCHMSVADGERIIRLVAHHVGAEVHGGAPRISAELPEGGERFEGLLPPVVAAPCFAIRKLAAAVFTLADYVAAGVMSDWQAEALTRAVEARKNILVAGGTSTGKTTLTNALLAKVACCSDRIVLIEDTRELQCVAPNLVSLRTKENVASLSDLVRSALRLRPDRIPIGEVRGAEALDLLKAWAALIAPGVVLNKDGSLQRSARFRGPDLDSATPAELIATTSRLNSALRRLGSGWAIFVEAVRRPAMDYPVSDFPDPASALVERERAAQFAEDGAHFESRYYLSLLWMPPAEEAARAENWLYEGRDAKGINPHELLGGFVDRTDRVLRLFERFFPEVAWLDDSETLTYLHSCISTRTQSVRVPETPMHLDALLADEPLTGGLEPRLGSVHLRTLTVVGFPSATFPGLLDDLNALNFAYRSVDRTLGCTAGTGPDKDFLRKIAGGIPPDILGKEAKQPRPLGAVQAGNQAFCASADLGHPV